MPKEVHITIPNGQSAAFLAGKNEENLKFLEENWNVTIIIYGNDLIIKGKEKDVESVAYLINQLSIIWASGHALSLRKLKYVVDIYKEDPNADIKNLFSEILLLNSKGKPVGPKTLQQRTYLNSISKNELIFAFGPAGTGKTYLAVAMAVMALKDKEVSRIILTRPVVEAGENLGFLPGDIMAKVDPYFRPLYDALYDLMGFEKVQKLIERNTIEIAPLAYMRGRTLHDSFIILDEAQNTTPEQLKMFLTRLGIGSKAIVTGDLTQIDLGRGKICGLKEIEKILKSIPKIKFIHFTDRDIVRHELVQYIVKAYEKHENNIEKSLNDGK